MCRKMLPGQLGGRAYLHIAKRRGKLKEARIVIKKHGRRVNNGEGMDI